MWKCRKCGRSFRNENQSHFCGKAPETVDEYISEQDAGIQEQLQLVRKAIRDELPEAKEKISSLDLNRPFAEIADSLDRIAYESFGNMLKRSA